MVIGHLTLSQPYLLYLGELIPVTETKGILRNNPHNTASHKTGVIHIIIITVIRYADF